MKDPLSDRKVSKNRVSHCLLKTGNLKKELKRLFKSMDYIADEYLCRRKISQKDITMFYSIYQQLGCLWEFLSLQCKHADGYKKKDNKFLCKICGQAKDTKQHYYLLPILGKKIIGRMVKPRKDNLEKLSRKEAEIVNDTIKFYGAKLNVSVFSSYPSRLGKTGDKMNIAADRMVTLEENGLIIDISKYITGIRIKKMIKQGPICGGFLWELPKKILKKMPIILSCDKNGKLAEIELLI